MSAVTLAQLRAIMPRLSETAAERYLGPLNAALVEFGITTAARQAAFLAQLAHESGELRYWAEIWGPTDAQKRYEGRADLGNTQPGDGYRYRGRGPIQVTGRANYAKYGRLLKLDLVGNPDQAELPEVGFRLAGSYWQTHNLNALADEGSFELITRRINGGLNGLADRLKYWERAERVLDRDEPAVTTVPVEVNGVRLKTAGRLLDGVTWAPLRELCEALGADVTRGSDGMVRVISKLNGG